MGWLDNSDFANSNVKQRHNGVFQYYSNIKFCYFNNQSSDMIRPEFNLIQVFTLIIMQVYEVQIKKET